MGFCVRRRRLCITQRGDRTVDEMDWDSNRMVHLLRTSTKQNGSYTKGCFSWGFTDVKTLLLANKLFSIYWTYGLQRTPWDPSISSDRSERVHLWDRSSKSTRVTQTNLLKCDRVSSMRKGKDGSDNDRLCHLRQCHVYPRSYPAHVIQSWHLVSIIIASIWPRTPLVYCTHTQRHFVSSRLAPHGFCRRASMPNFLRSILREKKNQSFRGEGGCGKELWESLRFEITW